MSLPLHIYHHSVIKELRVRGLIKITQQYVLILCVWCVCGSLTLNECYHLQSIQILTLHNIYVSVMTENTARNSETAFSISTTQT
jgi:hypothetical protein